MALTKQIDIITNASGATFFIKLYDSAGVAYTSTNPKATNGTISYNLSLNGASKGKANIIDPNAKIGAEGNAFNTLKPAFANSMMYSYFMRVAQSAPFTTRLSFTTAIDIGSVAVFNANVANATDLEIRIYDESGQNYKSSIYTGEQQKLDYPESVRKNTANPKETSPFIPPKVVMDNKGSLPKMIKIIRKADKIYIKPKIA